jgi:tetratricopeptide (TPR) repeat protein
MVELVNKDAIDDFTFALYDGATGFYIITASAYMHKQLAAHFIAENVAVYDYSGKKNTDTFSPQELFYFMEDNHEKEVFFILNFQIPFLGKQPKTTQPDYFALNLCRDALHDYNKKIFFFTTKEMEVNISIAAMDFFDYCFHKIAFEDEKKDEAKRQIRNLHKDYDNISHKAEIEYRLNLYKDKIEEYSNIPEKQTSENYLLIAARDLSYFAGLYRKLNDFDNALRFNKKALGIYEKILGEENINTINLYGIIGNIYGFQGNYSKALEFYQKALTIYEKVLDNEHPSVAALYNNIGYIYFEQSNYSKALEFHQKALEIQEKVLGNEHLDVATSYNNIGNACTKQGDYSKALEFHQKALEIRVKVLGNEHSNVATSYNNIGTVYDSQGNYSKALEFYQKALKIQEKALGHEHPDVATSYNNIGNAYDSQGDYSKALYFYQKALKIRKKVLGDSHPDTVVTRKNIEIINNEMTV